MLSEENVLSGLYDAAAGSGTWQGAMDGLCRHVGSFGAVAFSVQEPGQAIPMTQSLDECFEAYIRGGWNLRDDRFRGIPLLKHKRLYVESDFTSPDEMKSWPFYQEFLASFDLRWGAVLGLNVEDKLWVLSFQRTIGEGPFVADEQNQIALLAPHISRAVMLHTLNERARCQGLLEGLEAVHCAGFLVDTHGHVSQMNASAQSLMGHGLTVADGHLISPDQDGMRNLAALIHSAVTEKAERDVTPHCVVLRRDNRHPLVARVIPLRREARAMFSGGSAIVLVTVPEHRTQTAEEIIRKVFQLTHAETRVALLLAEGKSLPHCSEALGYTIGSVQQLVKRILAKTGTHRQSELSSLLQIYLR